VKRAPENGFIASRFVPTFFQFTASSVTSTMKYNLNFLEGTVGRPFYQSQRIIVDASFGLKSWWASYKFDLLFDFFSPIDFEPAGIGTQNCNAGVGGIGPYVSAKIQALLTCGFYIIGKAGVWPAYTRLNKYRTVTNYPEIQFVFPAFVNEEINDSEPFVTQMMYEASAGLGWGTSFCGCAYYANLIIGYDMMTNYFGLDVAAQGKAPRAFYYQGLSVRAQFDF